MVILIATLDWGVSFYFCLYYSRADLIVYWKQSPDIEIPLHQTLAKSLLGPAVNYYQIILLSDIREEIKLPHTIL